MFDIKNAFGIISQKKQWVSDCHLLFLAWLMFFCALMGLSRHAFAGNSIKDADGNLLPPAVRMLIGQTGRGEDNNWQRDEKNGEEVLIMPFVTPKGTSKKQAWKFTGYANYLDEEGQSSDNGVWRYHDIELGKINVTIFRKYIFDKSSGDPSWMVTDVILNRNRYELSVWGSECSVFGGNIPNGYILGMVFDSRTIFHGNTVILYKKPGDECESCSKKTYLWRATRAYLLNKSNGKISKFNPLNVWCPDPLSDEY